MVYRLQSASNLFPIRLVSAPFQFKRAKGYFELGRSKTAARRRLFMLCFCRTCHDALWFALITTHFAVQTDLLSPTSSFFGTERRHPNEGRLKITKPCVWKRFSRPCNAPVYTKTNTTYLLLECELSDLISNWKLTNHLPKRVYGLSPGH